MFAFHAGKMIRSMVTFAVIYCVCVWSIVCFSCVEADPLPHQHQMNTNGNSGIAIHSLPILLRSMSDTSTHAAFTGCYTSILIWDEMHDSWSKSLIQMYMQIIANKPFELDSFSLC